MTGESDLSCPSAAGYSMARLRDDIMAVTSDSFQDGFSAADVSGGTDSFPYLRSSFTTNYVFAHTHGKKSTAPICESKEWLEHGAWLGDEEVGRKTKELMLWGK